MVGSPSGAEPGFRPGPEGTPTALQLIGGGRADGQGLTKEQKRFNQLVKKIKAARQQIERFKEADQELRSLGQEKILPMEEKWLRATRDLVLALHTSPHQSSLTRRHKQKFRVMMNAEITLLLNTSFFVEDTKLRDLFGIYTESGLSFEEMAAANAEQERKAAAEMFGMDLDPEDMADPATLKERLDARAEELRQQGAAEPTARKQTKAQLASETKRQAAESAVKKTTRQIYVDLVKHCHPDREQDELKRIEKTEWMKQITAAYEVDDHLGLLEMQMTLLAERENAFADFNESELRYFNQSLQRQLTELENEVMMAHPMHTGNSFGSLYHPNRNVMIRELEMERSSLKHRLQAVGHITKLIASEQGFKQYLVDYVEPRAIDRDFDDADGFRWA